MVTHSPVRVDAMPQVCGFECKEEWHMPRGISVGGRIMYNHSQIGKRDAFQSHTRPAETYDVVPREAAASVVTWDLSKLEHGFEHTPIQVCNTRAVRDAFGGMCRDCRDG